MTDTQHTKWVACWGNATSITDRKECVYAKDITLRYPIKICFDCSAIRLRLSNLTGTETVRLSEVYVSHEINSKYESLCISHNGNRTIEIPAGEEILTDPLEFTLRAGNTIDVNIYIKECTQMNAGTLVTGPLSKGKYSYRNNANVANMPIDKTRDTNIFYFLNTVEVLTNPENRAIVCYGDSITAQSWPDYLTIRAWEEGFRNIAIIRRAVCGTRILRQYDCITYQSYGLKGATRFPIEANTAGASTVIIQHGINDIIHPVGVENNPFRPWSDMPTLQNLEDGMENLYVKHARSLGMKVWCGTLLPIYGWRTYNEDRDILRNQFNNWMRSSELFDGCIDFDKAVRNNTNNKQFADGFDSGDHLHPSEAAYKAMAYAVPLVEL